MAEKYDLYLTSKSKQVKSGLLYQLNRREPVVLQRLNPVLLKSQERKDDQKPQLEPEAKIQT